MNRISSKENCTRRQPAWRWCSLLLSDQRGVVAPASYLFIVTILGIGMIVGLATVRDNVVQEMCDIGVALENVKQSYSFTVNGTTSEYQDDGGGDDPGGANDDNPADPDGEEPGCLSIREPSSNESETGGGGGGDDEEV